MKVIDEAILNLQTTDPVDRHREQQQTETEQGGKVVDNGVKLTSEAGKSIHKLRNSVSLASQAAIQIAASSGEQMSGITQVVTAMENIKTATSQNVESSKQLEEEAHNLNNLGQRLKKLIQKYKI